jgi:hypothetical protein
MSLSIGIVGMPNVGKSTMLNALTKGHHALVANYPFCTIEPNHAVVQVPDARLEKLGEMIKPRNLIHATLEFVDIAGLVKGSSKGEGLGNQFLGHIRETAAIVHVVRCFDDENVVHVNGRTDPREDIEVINTELILADLQQLERKIDALGKQLKGDRKFQPAMDIAHELKKHLESGQPVRTFPVPEEIHFEELNTEMRFTTGKPVIYAANVDEAGLGADSAYLLAVQDIARREGAEVIKVCAKFEEEMVEMTEEERHEFLELDGAHESGLEQIIHKGFRMLGLITFFTMAPPKEVRAWTLRQGWTAPKAAGTIHTDFERGFIRAEVIPFEAFAKHGGEPGAKAAGAMRLEGKEYVVQDGDCIYFRFNV